MKFLSVDRGDVSRRRLRAVAVLAGASVLIAPLAAAFAQDDSMEEIVVKGYKGSLLNSTAAKRESNGFTDEIFADDIGKLPSQNLAESLNRIPGVKISREVTGEGLQISVRGLGPSFTKVVLNGNNIWLASDGPLNAGQRNREVDLGVFPSELFTSLAVSKSSNAAQLEGGISGYVNLRPAHAFDTPGQQIKFSAEGAYTDINGDTSPRASVIYSNTWNDNVGLLVGVTTKHNKMRVDGYETIGYTDGCLVADDGNGGMSCAPGSIGRNRFEWNPTATADYAAAHPGVNVGDPLDLEAITGQSAETLDTAIFPYLGRGVLVDGNRDTTTALISFEYKPSDEMHFALDTLYTKGKNHFNRADMMLYARNTFFNAGNAMVPENMTVDSNGVITGVTLYNSSYFTEERDYIEDLDFYSLMPSFNWQINDALGMDVSASYTKSTFDRDNPTWLYATPRDVTTYTQNGDVPSFDIGFDVNGTTGWQWYNGASGFRMARAHRVTETKGLHADFGLGEEPDRNGVKFGVAYDEAQRNMKAYAAPTNYTTDVYAAIPDPTPYLMPMNVSDYGGTMDGNLGYSGWAQINYKAIKQAEGYKDWYKAMTLTGGDEFGQSVGDIDETYTGLYAMLNTEGEMLGRAIRTNVGVRWVTTDQTMGYLDTAAGQYITTKATYAEWLPSFSTVFDLTDDIKIRAAASRSMTRANPAYMFPNAAWSSVGISTVRAGNPYLSPYFSDNIDIGGEWYFGDIGYVGLTFFNKKIDGFTRSDNFEVQIRDVANYGIDLTDIQSDQARWDEIVACGGLDSPQCKTVITTQINVEGSTSLKGFEGIWVQPLDNLVEGLGFNVSVTKINQSSASPDANVLGISPWSYNLTGYYENDAFQVRVTYFHQDEAIASGPTDSNYDGDPLPLRRAVDIARSQLDLATSYRLPTSMELVLTFDAYNLTNEPVGQWYEYKGTVNQIYYPGATYTLGLRGSF
jgi:TonB-dependent receptor